ncbi:DUF5994 family protein [Actinomycetospora lemnae]|uniref:DUF5994 family protein n=1 Tax=Actinomycetospora lemnae TaxID=3019891 RepID=A0ABT5SYK6_9PSEU|nr:DUF5994 family protein [Actinomycetospora sp. DW7H6]MDD7967834.1 DUF5994 family protein [Actinomycetospora sp. DW7H6]
MSPAPSTPTPTVAGPADDVTPSGRLRLKPVAPVSGHVDGGWWPHSRDLPAELPTMLTELGLRVGPVARVSYHLGGWDRAPRRLPSSRVRLEGFRTTDPHTLTVVGATGARIVLLVVPPETSGPAAEAALDAASEAGDRHATAELLAAGPGTASS